LATCHSKGIALWGGEDFRRIAKFSHSGVQFIDFSPCENYMVTFSPETDIRASLEEPTAIIIWETRTGELVRHYFVITVAHIGRYDLLGAAKTC